MFSQSMFKTCQFKTWSKGDKSNVENSTDHFREDTGQKASCMIEKTLSRRRYCN